MKQYLLNKEESLKLYNKHQDKIEPKDCYINIFNILTIYPQNFHSGEWMIAYGYVSSIENVYCRHCFVLAGDEIIDPTLFSTDRDNSSRTYYLFKVFDSVGEYLEALDSEKGYPALTKHLHKEDSEALKWAQQNGYLFIG